MTPKLEIETYLIGALLGQTNISAVRAIIKPIHFSDLDLRATYERLLKLDDEGRPLDFANLIDLNFDLTPVLSMKSGIASVEQMEYYAQQLLRYYSQLEAQKMIDMASSQLKSTDYDQVLPKLNESLENLLVSRRVEEPDFAAQAKQWAERASQSRSEPTIFSGLETLDNYLRPVQGSRVVLIAGRPGDGKTALAVQMALRSSAQKKKCAFFSLETDVNQLMPVFHANALKINRSRLAENDLSELNTKLDTEAYRKFAANPIKIYSDKIHIDEIKSKIIHLHKTSGLDLVFIDYIGLICGNEKRSDTQSIALGRISRELKLLSLRLEIPIVVLAQLNRDCVKTSRRPEMADLRDSGSLEQDADFILMLHGPKSEQEEFFKHKTELMVVKNRTGSIGLGGFADFNGRYQEFVETEAPLAVSMSTYAKQSRGG